MGSRKVWTNAVWVWCPLLVAYLIGKSLSFLVDETPRVGINDNRVLFGGSVFRQMREVQASPCISCFSSVHSSKNNEYIKEAYFAVACPELLSHILGWHILLPSTCKASPGCGDPGLMFRVLLSILALPVISTTARWKQLTLILGSPSVNSRSQLMYTPQALSTLKILLPWK